VSVRATGPQPFAVGIGGGRRWGVRREAAARGRERGSSKRAHLLSPSIILNSALAESGSLILAADTAHCKARDCQREQPPAGAAHTHSNPVCWRGGCTSLFGCWLYSCVSSGTLMGPSFFGHPPPCKQNPFSSLYSDVSLYLQQQQAFNTRKRLHPGYARGGRGGGVCTSRCGRETQSCGRDGAQRGAAAAARCRP
jgi:hypothetical protein